MRRNIESSVSWVELGEIGEQKVIASIPTGFAHFRNIYVPCCHGYGKEEIDLVVTGPTGIWCIEVKNWRGIAYLGDYPEEIVFVRNTIGGERTSYRDNPYKQARRHAEDLHHYLSQNLKTWFPSVQTLVVFAQRDRKGVNGANLYRIRIRNSNPSIVYLDEMPERISEPSNLVRHWDKWHLVAEFIGKLPTRSKSFLT